MQDAGEQVPSLAQLGDQVDVTSGKGPKPADSWVDVGRGATILKS